jgi:hypothetical protein
MILYIHGTTSWTYLKAGKSGTEVLAWIRKHSSHTEPQIMMWSEYQAQRSPSHAEGLDFYNESLQKIARTVMILQYAGPEGYNSQLAILSKRNLNVKSH